MSALWHSCTVKPPSISCRAVKPKQLNSLSCRTASLGSLSWWTANPSWTSCSSVTPDLRISWTANPPSKSCCSESPALLSCQSSKPIFRKCWIARPPWTTCLTVRPPSTSSRALMPASLNCQVSSPASRRWWSVFPSSSICSVVTASCSWIENLPWKESLLGRKPSPVLNCCAVRPTSRSWQSVNCAPLSPLNNKTLSTLEWESVEIRGHFSLLVESVPCETNAASAGTAPVGSGSVHANCQLSRIVRRPHERLPIPPQAVASAIFRIVSDNLQASALLISYRVDRTPAVNPKAFKALQRRAPWNGASRRSSRSYQHHGLAAPVFASMDVQLAAWRLLLRLGGHHHDCLRVPHRDRGNRCMSDRLASKALALTHWAPSSFGNWSAKALRANNRRLLLTMNTLLWRSCAPTRAGISTTSVSPLSSLFVKVCTDSPLHLSFRKIIEMDVCKMQLLNIYFLDTMSPGAVVKLWSGRVQSWFCC